MLKHMTLGLLAAGLCVAPAMAETKWDMPTPYPDNNFHTKNVRQFAEDVEKATNGQLKIVVHSAGSLIKHPEIKKSVRQGIAPIGEILQSLAANENPIYEVDSIPFLTASYEDAKKLYAAQKPYLEKQLVSEGLMLLYSVAWPAQGLYTKKEIKTIEDMAGLKFRTYSAATSRIAQLVNAVPTQVEVPDIPTAFATGRVEAMFTSPSTGVDMKAWDYLTHFHDLQAWQPRNIVFVNKAAFEKLTPEQQKAVRDAAAAAEERGWKMSEEEFTAQKKVLADNGIKVLPGTDELLKPLKKVGEQMAAEWEQKAGPNGKAILEAYRK
jgi:TRAP-type C4-dicarboxylate transport system substrate-binding protein